LGISDRCLQTRQPSKEQLECGSVVLAGVSLGSCSTTAAPQDYGELPIVWLHEEPGVELLARVIPDLAPALTHRLAPPLLGLPEPEYPEGKTVSLLL